jgi:azurin
MGMKLAIVIVAGLVYCVQASAQDCSITIEGNDLIQFNMSEMRVSAACSEVTVTLTHVGELPAAAMGHNWVLSRTADFMPLAQAGQAAGAPEYLPENDARVLAATSMIGGGQETSVTFSLAGLEAGGDYTFFCSFPGHFVLMNGKFHIE